MNTIVERLVKLSDELVASLPPSCVKATVERRPGVRGEVVSIWLNPANPSSGQIVIDAEDGNPIVGLLLGRRTPIEVLQSKEQKVEDQVAEVCKAVFNGAFEEDLWLVGSEVVRCVAKIRYGGRDHIFRYYGGFYPLKTKKKEHIQYSPYFAAAGGAYIVS